MKFWRYIPAAAIALLAVGSSLSAVPSKTIVDVRCDGDDGLTQRVCAALKDEFKAAPDFTLSIGNKSGTLIVRVPTNVDWKQVGKRMKVKYRAEFTTTSDQKIGATAGSCWEDELKKCAAQVVKHAEVVRQKYHT